MAQPRDFDRFYAPPGETRIWRIAHLSDLHVVGERYGFRIESGRSGPRGNDRLQAAIAKLEILCGKQQLDAILITGDGDEVKMLEKLEQSSAVLKADLVRAADKYVSRQRQTSHKRCSGGSSERLQGLRRSRS